MTLAIQSDSDDSQSQQTDVCKCFNLAFNIYTVSQESNPGHF